MARNLGEEPASTTDVRATVMAMLANKTPMSEAGAAAAGTDDQVSRADHVHKRLTSATVHTTAVNGKQTVTFTRTFDSQPVVMCDLVEAADNGPVTFKVESWIDDQGAGFAVGAAPAAGRSYGGAVVYGYRTRTLPSLQLLTVVTFILSGVNALFQSLSGFAPYTAAGSVGFSCLAIQRSGS